MEPPPKLQILQPLHQSHETLSSLQRPETQREVAKKYGQKANAAVEAS
jgi:hypothetical protein